MTQENTRAQEIAIEALIAASLRVPDEGTEVTEEEINRFVNQQVTLNQEDEAALERSKPQAMQAISEILKGKEQINCINKTRSSKAEKLEFAAMNRKNATNEFSALTDSELDRKRKEMIEKIKQKQRCSNS
jgi:hypothetical protein